MVIPEGARNTMPASRVRDAAAYSQDKDLPHDDRHRRFERLARPHLDAAHNLARWLAGNTTDAEDVVQDAYLRAYRYFDSSKEEISACGY
jgi:DNA-directed RNA polymerase specialized sigma24 family protein